jgi:hypothetical protein
MTTETPGTEGTEGGYADDVTDLREAQRIISQLRRKNEELEVIARPAENEFSAFLSQEHAERLQQLFDARALLYRRDNDLDLHEGFTEFVQQVIDIRWDEAEADGLLRPRGRRRRNR